MISYNLIEIVETIAIGMTLVFFISPIKMMISLYYTKDTKTTPFLLYIFTTFTCLTTSVYGIQIHAPPIWVTNIIGGVLFVMFLAISIYYCSFTNKQKLALILSLYIYVILHCYISFKFISKENNGLISMISNTVNNFAPMHQIYLTYVHDDISYIDIWVTSGLIISNYAWGHYAVLINMNMYILLPSIFGVFVALMQFILWFIFNRNTALKEESEGVGGLAVLGVHGGAGVAVIAGGVKKDKHSYHNLSIHDLDSDDTQAEIKMNI